MTGRDVTQPATTLTEAERLARAYFEGLGWDWDELDAEDRAANARGFLPVVDAARSAPAERAGSEAAIKAEALREAVVALIEHFQKEYEFWQAEAQQRNDVYSFVHRDLYRYYSRDDLTPMSVVRRAAALSEQPAPEDGDRP